MRRRMSALGVKRTSREQHEMAAKVPPCRIRNESLLPTLTPEGRPSLCRSAYGKTIGEVAAVYQCVSGDSGFPDGHQSCAYCRADAVGAASTEALTKRSDPAV